MAGATAATIDLPRHRRLTGHVDPEANVTDDSQLVRQMLAGDERAFTAFFTNYFPRIYRFALPRLGRHEDVAKDVVQATVRGEPFDLKRLGSSTVARFQVK